MVSHVIYQCNQISHVKNMIWFNEIRSWNRFIFLYFSDADGGSNSVWETAGIAIGVIAAVALILVVVVVIMRKRARRSRTL